MGQSPSIRNRRPSLDIAKELIATKAQLIPLDKIYEDLKEEIRPYGAQTYQTDKGVVTVSEPEVRTFKARVPKLNPDKYLLLSADYRDVLEKLGVVEWEDTYTRNAKAKVETVPT